MFANGGVSLLVVSALLFSAILAAPSVLQPYNVFTSQIQEDVKLRFIKNSGVCETTPGVLQMSGYIDIGTNMSMVSFCIFEGHQIIDAAQWFWFFEARHEPESAPFTLWYVVVVYYCTAYNTYLG